MTAWSVHFPLDEDRMQVAVFDSYRLACGLHDRMANRNGGEGMLSRVETFDHAGRMVRSSGEHITGSETPMNPCEPGVYAWDEETCTPVKQL